MSGESEIESMVVRLTGNTSQYVQSIKEAEDTTVRYDQTVKKLRDENGRFIKSSQETVQATGKLRDENGRFIKGSQNMTREQRKAVQASIETAKVMKQGKLVTQSVENATEKYNKEIKELNRLLKAGAISQQTHARATAKATKEYRMAGSALSNMGTKLRSVGLQLAMVSAAMAGIGIAAVKTSLDFNESMDKIVGLVGLSQETVEDFKKEVLAMSGEVGKGPKELADALFFVTSAGFRGSEALDVLRESAKASAAGLGSTEGVADAVTSAVNSYGKANLSAKKATEILTASVRAGKAEASAFGPVLGRVLPAAQELGVTFDQTAGSIAFLTKSTGDAAQSATGMAGIFNTLMKPSEQAQKALGKLGTSFGELKEQVKSQGLLPSLVSLRKRLDEAGIPLAKVFSETQALNAVLLMTGPAAKDAAEVIKSVGDSAGIVDEAFKASSETAGGRLAKAFASLKVALVLMGDALAPVVEKFSSFVSGVSRWFSTLSKETRTYIVIVGGLIAALGPALIIIGSMVSAIGTLSTAFATMQVSATLATASSLAFKASLIGLAVWVGVKLGTALASTNKHMIEYNKQTKLAIKLNNQLSEATDKKLKTQIEELTNTSDVAKRMEKTQSAIIEVEKNLEGVSNKITSQEKEVDKLNTAWNRWTGNLLLTDAQRELSQFESQKERLQQQVKELREFLKADTTKDTNLQQKLGLGIDPKLQGEKELEKSLLAFNSRLSDQANQLVLTSSEIELYKLRLAGLSDEQLRSAKAAQQQLTEVSEFNSSLKKAKQLTDSLITPQQKLEKQQQELIDLRKKGMLTLNAFTKLMKKNKEEMDDLSEVDVKFNVSGLDGVKSGTSEAANRIREFLALRPEAKKPFKIDDPLKGSRVIDQIQAQANIGFDDQSIRDLTRNQVLARPDLAPETQQLIRAKDEVLVKKEDGEDRLVASNDNWFGRLNTNLNSLVEIGREQLAKEGIILDTGEEIE